MKTLKVIPVIDVLNDKVVHAVRGNRAGYKNIESVLTKSVEPTEVAKAFTNLGFTELYVADLDAIIDCSSDFQALRQIVNDTGLKLMVDAGVTSIDRAQSLLGSGVSKIVVGTETLKSKSFVEEAIRVFGCDRVIVSLDLRGETALALPEFDGSRDALSLVMEFKVMGVCEVIVLDLARVGSGEGVNIEFLERVREQTALDVYVGGGVRDVEDLVELKNLGLSGALIATALHSGKITVEQLKKEGLL